MNRIEARMKKLQEKKEKAFITYMTAGLPDMEGMKAIIKANENAGCDVIELGIPFSDPVADGPVIQAASYKAIFQGVNLKGVLKEVEALRKEGAEIPIVFMMYYNTILHYGVKAFVESCVKAGVDGLIVPDLPFEEQGELKRAMREVEQEKSCEAPLLIQLVSPVSGERIPDDLKRGKRVCLLCFVYGGHGAGCGLPQGGYELSDKRKGGFLHSGHDGLWNPEGGGCEADEGHH